MFPTRDYARTLSITSAQELLAACREQAVIRLAIPEGWELQLPRVYAHSRQDNWAVDRSDGSQWVAHAY